MRKSVAPRGTAALLMIGVLAKVIGGAAIAAMLWQPAAVHAQSSECNDQTDCIPEFVETPRTPGSYSVCVEYGLEHLSSSVTAAVAYWNAKTSISGVAFGTPVIKTQYGDPCDADFVVKIGDDEDPNVPGFADFDTKEIWLDTDWLTKSPGNQPNWAFILGHEFGHQMGFGDVEDCAGFSALATGVPLATTLPSSSSCPDINATHQGYSSTSEDSVTDWIPSGAWDCWDEIWTLTIYCTVGNQTWICGFYWGYTGNFQCGGGDPLPN